MRPPRQSGYTLVEIMIVLVLIGLLAAMALPAFKRSRERSQNTRLSNDFRIFSGLIDTYTLEAGNFPDDASPGQLPAGFDEYVKSDQWTNKPSIGGQWDIAKDVSGTLSAVGVSEYSVNDSQLLAFDTAYDDGNLSTGFCRKFGGSSYYYVVAE